MKKYNLHLTGTVFLLTLLLLIAGLSAHATATPTVTTLSVTAAGSPVTSVPALTVVTLTATVTAAGAPVTPGQVDFCDANANSCTDIHRIASGSLSASPAGVVTYKFVPGPGAHSYKAVFHAGNGYAASSSSAAALTVTGKNPTSTAITQSGTAGNYTLTATVGGVAGTAPTGTISFQDLSANQVLATAPLTAATSGLNFLTTLYQLPYYCTGSVAVGDFNNDGILDAVAIQEVSSQTTGQLTVLLGNGDGAFTTSATIALPAGSCSATAVGDMNNDGNLDIVTTVEDASGDVYVTVLYGAGDGTFSEGSEVPTKASGAPTLALGDFNNDGILDVALADWGNSRVIVLLGGQTVLPAMPVTGATPVFIASGDLNGDGILDLVTANSGDGTNSLTVLLGNGDGTFTPVASSPPVGTYPDSIVIADFNGDGIPDLATANYTSNNVTVLLGKGDGTFTATAASPAAGNNPISIVTGDFNSDGRVDLAVTNFRDFTPTVLLGDGDGSFTTLPSSGAPVSPTYEVFGNLMTAGDLNGDGVPDLIVAEAGSVRALVAATSTATATANGVAVPPATQTNMVDAAYPGDSNYLPSTSQQIGLAAVKGTPQVTLTASANPAIYGRTVTFTVTVTGTGIQPTGNVSAPIRSAMACSLRAS